MYHLHKIQLYISSVLVVENVQILSTYRYNEKGFNMYKFTGVHRNFTEGYRIRRMQLLIA
jgi:hypothetical protein